MVTTWKTRNIRPLFPLKDKSDYKSSVIHKGNCSCRSSYIGETKCNVEVRRNEHNNLTKFQNHQNTFEASLAKWVSVSLRTKWFWVRVQLQSLKLQMSRLLGARNSLTFRELQSVYSL